MHCGDQQFSSRHRRPHLGAFFARILKSAHLSPSPCSVLHRLKQLVMMNCKQNADHGFTNPPAQEFQTSATQKWNCPSHTKPVPVFSTHAPERTASPCSHSSVHPKQRLSPNACHRHTHFRESLLTLLRCALATP